MVGFRLELWNRRRWWRSEKTLAGLLIRHDRIAAYGQGLAKSLIISKKESLILFQRAAGRRSKLILAKRRIGALSKIAARIEITVSQKFVE